MAAVSARTRRDLIEVIQDRYRAGSPADKRRILDEFVALTGYHRKHAIRVLRAPRPAPISRPPRSRVYDETVRQALVVLWEASDRICGKRLKAVLPDLVLALERHRHLSLDPVVRDRLLAASAATIDRLLARARAAARGTRRTRRALPLVSQRTPVLTPPGDEPRAPGYLTIDLVAHSGDESAEGCAHTLVLTDVAVGWIMYTPLPACEAALIVAGLDRLRATLPFPVRGLSTGDGHALIDDVVRAYCGEHRIELTRSQLRDKAEQPRDKADRARLAQRHDAGTRHLVGTGRLAGPRALDALERLYTAVQRFANFFQPSFKLAEKHQVGARVRKRHLSPETPCARLLGSRFVDEAVKDALRAELATLDPRRLREQVRTARQDLARLSTSNIPPPHPRLRRDAALDRFLPGFATAWKQAELRPAPRGGGRPPRRWRTREDPFDGVWPQVVGWMEAEPDRTARQVLQRLRDEGLGEFPDGQLRTLQRRIKAWRAARAGATS